MSALESKIGDFLFDTSCELGLKGNDLLQQCMNILQQKMSKIKPSELTLQHPTPVTSYGLSLEIPSSTRATPGSRTGFSPFPSSAFTSRTPILRAASKESCFVAQVNEDEDDNDEEEQHPLNTSMDSEDVNLIDGLSDATICSNLTNEFAEHMEANDSNIVIDSSSEKPKRKRAPRQVDPLKAAMKARKEELSKEKQAQKEAKAAEKMAKALEKEAKAAEKVSKIVEKAKENPKKAKEDADADVSEEVESEPKRKPKRKAVDSSTSSVSATSSGNAEPEKKKRRTRKPLDVQASKAVVIHDGDMFGDREEVAEELREKNQGAEEEDDAEIQGFVDEDEEEDDDGVSIDGGEVDDIWQKKVIDGKPYTISSMTNKVYNSSLFVVGERNKETGDIRFYSSSPQPAVFELKA
jgi:hypothetical protein